MKNCVLFAALIVIVIDTVPITAATVTVSGLENDYATIHEALDNLGAGDDWGDGDDMIVVTDHAVHIVSEEILVRAKNGGSLAIVAADGAEPIFAADPQSIPDRIFRPRAPGTILFEGLTCIGAAGIYSEQLRQGFHVDNSKPGTDLNVTIRRCVVTANDGNNQPRTDWITGERDQIGSFKFALQMGDDAVEGNIDLNVEYCTFAFNGHEDGLVRLGRTPERHIDPVVDIQFTHCLFANAYQEGIVLEEMTEHYTIGFRECCVIDAPSHLLYIRQCKGDGPSINIEDTVFDNTMGWRWLIQTYDMTGRLSFRRVTFMTQGVSPVYLWGHDSGNGHVEFQDILTAEGGPTLCVVDTYGIPVRIGSIWADNIVMKYGSAVNLDQDPAIIEAFNAVYGGAGALEIDPMFVDLDRSQLDGMIGWDRATNSLYDVANYQLYGKGWPGGRPGSTFTSGALTGGADMDPSIPEPTPIPFAPELLLQVVSPKGGERFIGQDEIEVAWRSNYEANASTTIPSSGSIPTPLRVEIWNTSGYVATLGYAYGVTSRLFELPDIPDGDDYRIRAITTDEALIYDFSDGVFTIMKGPVTLYSPVGGEVFDGDAYMPIRWATDLETAGSAVGFELYRDADFVAALGATWNPNGEGVAEIMLPMVPESDNYRIRAISLWDPKLEDWCDEAFSIHGGPLRVYSPNGGETWEAGGQGLVHWKANTQFAGTAVDLEIWNASGQVADLGWTWDPDGEHVRWIEVPSVATGSDYRVRAVSIWDGTYFDLSDAPFTILGAPQNAIVPGRWLLYE